MWLLNIESMRLKFFETSHAPRYAILSHTWGEDEVSHQEFLAAKQFPPSDTHGWAKIIGACKKAGEAGFGWIWIDTCCIDKTSSAELSEAINSMFNWYRSAEICYAFLEDYEGISAAQQKEGGEKDDDEFGSMEDIYEEEEEKEIRLLEQGLSKARWFTRGWTLQELIASPDVEFCDKNWKTIGHKKSLCKILARITSIHERVLVDLKALQSVSIAQKFSWAADRQTSRQEDIAYCLLGIFGINMPLLYGEGERSFIRLQEEIIKSSEDQSIFAWEYLPESQVSEWDGGILAKHPVAFKSASHIVPSTSDGSVYDMSNRGLRIHAPVQEDWLAISDQLYHFTLVLFCHGEDEEYTLGISLEQVPGSENKFYRRYGSARIRVPTNSVRRMSWKTIYVHRSGDLHIQDKGSAVFLRSYPRHLLTLVNGWYSCSCSNVSEFRLKTAQAWNRYEERAVFTMSSKPCIVVLVFKLNIFHPPDHPYFIVLIRALSGSKDSVEVRPRQTFRKEELEAAIKDMCAVSRRHFTREISILDRKYTFYVACSRQAMFDELTSAVDISVNLVS